jgi:type I restriction enzyme S subunit
VSLQTFLFSLAPLTDAPNSVAKLKTLIVNLAVRGNLQIDDGDSRLSGSAGYGAITCDSIKDAPYDLPSHWQWCLLHEVADILDYRREPISEEERNLRTAGKKKEELYPYYGATQQTGWIDDYIFDEELVLLGEDGVPFFDPDRPKAYLVSGKYWVNNHAHVLRGVKVINRFLLHYLNIFDYGESITGTTRLKLNQSRMKTIPVPIPPLEEQKQVVAKVEELMRLCDELEAAQQAKRESRVRLNNITLAPLNNAASLAPEEIEQASGRLADNFAALYDSAETVGKLRSTILQLAVKGKLVPQDAHDEPASALLKDVAKEKQRQIQERKSKQIELLPGITENDALTNSMPRGWAWAWLGDLARFVDYRGKTPPKTEAGVKLITAKNVRMGFISEYPREFISENTYTEVMTRGFPKFGDILFTTEAPLGNVAQLLTDERIALAQRVIDLQTFSPLFSEYLKVCLMSPLMQRAMVEKATGMTATGIKASKLKLLPVPVPPLEEQKRIVAKVNQLMALCDELETKLRQAEADSEKLMNAAVQHVLERIVPKRTSDVAVAFT